MSVSPYNTTLRARCRVTLLQLVCFCSAGRIQDQELPSKSLPFDPCSFITLIRHVLERRSIKRFSKARAYDLYKPPASGPPHVNRAHRAKVIASRGASCVNNEIYRAAWSYLTRGGSNVPTASWDERQATPRFLRA